MTRGSRPSVLPTKTQPRNWDYFSPLMRGVMSEENKVLSPDDLDSKGLEEWDRIVAERDDQGKPVMADEADLLRVAATAYSYGVKIRQLLAYHDAPCGPEHFYAHWKQGYIGVCQALGCTPALPNIEEWRYERSKTERHRVESVGRQSRKT